jgi:hypothetical protein
MNLQRESGSFHRKFLTATGKPELKFASVCSNSLLEFRFFRLRREQGPSGP